LDGDSSWLIYIPLGSALIALASAAAAWGAVYASRKNAAETISSQTNIAARTARATVVSANRQRWIDALRDDVSDYMASAARLTSILLSGSFERSGQDALSTEERRATYELKRIRIRIELRLNLTEPDHRELLKLIDQFWVDSSAANDAAVRAHANAIFKSEWERLKKEAAGIDPLVKPLRLT
jgi:hypothetical protein